MRNLEDWAIWEVLNKLQLGEKVKFRNYKWKYVIIEKIESNYHIFSNLVVFKFFF